MKKQKKTVQCCEKTKKLRLSMNFFQILHDKEQIYNQKVVVIEIPEWTLKAKIARNTTFEENYD